MRTGQSDGYFDVFGFSESLAPDRESLSGFPMIKVRIPILTFSDRYG